MDQFTVGDFIDRFAEFPRTAIMAIDIQKDNDDEKVSIAIESDVATYENDEGTIISAPIVILRVGG